MLPVCRMWLLIPAIFRGKFTSTEAENSGCTIYIPAYHSGFSGIITEKHIKLRYYGEG